MAESEEQKPWAERTHAGESPREGGAEQAKAPGTAQGLLHKVSAASGKLKGKTASGTAAAMKAVKDASLKVAEKTAQGAAKASGTLKNNFEKLHDLASEAREADKKPDKRKLAVAAAFAGTFVVGGILGGVLNEALSPEARELKGEVELQLRKLDSKLQGDKDWEAFRKTLPRTLDAYEALVKELEGGAGGRYPMEEEFALLYECLMDGEEAGYLSISRGSYDELMPECVKVIGEFERQIPSLAEFKKVKGSFKVGTRREGRGR